ncbi:MAG TPA: electron transfer flavoprotein subunit alpha/FixB family protein, partial [Alphaproteobacteria bacterium]|nr:electron transfer flavoprotein subunit alpha/FixB family protein [Alphaproteobacteria bacterium]
MAVLILAEHDNEALKPATLSTLTAAGLLNDADLHVLVAGKDCRDVARAAARISGVTKVLLSDSDAGEHFLAENIAPLIAAVADGYGHVLAPASTYGKNILPRAAALLDVAQISDVIAIESPDTFVRPIYAGNALATVRSRDATKFLTVRPAAFDQATSGAGGEAEIEDIGPAKDAGQSAFTGQKLSHSERPELTAARIVVAGGRGMGGTDNFRLLEAVAERLDAAIGASRAAVDAGFVTNDCQVGQTGKVVAPDLYIAIGISGAIQHLAGMKDSKVIVAINKDEEAPIFR